MALNDSTAHSQPHGARAGVVSVERVRSLRFGRPGGVHDFHQDLPGQEAAGDRYHCVARTRGGMFGIHQQIQEHLFELALRSQNG